MAAKDQLRSVRNGLADGTYTTRAKRQQQMEWPSELASPFAGGNADNMPPANRKGPGGGGDDPTGDPVRASSHHGGEDTMEVGVYGRWSNWESIGAALRAAKQAAKQVSEEGEDAASSQCEVGRTGWLCGAHGTRPSGGGPTYSFILKRDGVTLLIANREEFTGTFPNVRVLLGSVLLMGQDPRDVWAGVVEQFDALGLEVAKTAVSRVDVCVDLPGVDVEEFVRKFRERHWVSRARKGEDYSTAAVYTTGLKSTGFRLGKGIMLRVYDKFEECKLDDVKFDAMLRFRWCGEVVERATRVEFQLRREQLKELTLPGPNGGVTREEGAESVDTVEDWFRLRGLVCEYLVSNWCRFTEGKPDVDNGHQADAKLWGWWEKVREKFRAWTGSGPGEVRRVKRWRCDFKQLKAQLIGVATSLVAYTVGGVTSAAELIEQAWRQVAETLGPEERTEASVLERFTRKRAAFLSRYPQACAGG